MSLPTVQLYTRQGCHLCDDARLVLQRHGLNVESIDIDADPALVELYTNCVPVVVMDGKVRFRGRVDEVLLRRLLVHPPAL
jgi:glutaredoxin